MSKKNILIVDDEPTQCKILKKFIDNMGHNSLVINEGMKVIDFFVNKAPLEGVLASDIDVMLLDLSMPDIDGITVLKKIDHIKANTQVIVLTASSDISLAVVAINLGATDYIMKGKEDIYARITASINNAIDKKNLKYQVSNLVRRGQNQVSFSDVIGHSELLTSNIDTAKRIVNAAIPVLIEGQNGCGKELLARAIHGSGNRSGKPFVVFECDMLKKELAEEELFGIEKNANDVKGKIGKLKEADGGTLFLKRIDCLGIELQTRLLRFLQEGEYRTIGSDNICRANVRIISSSNRDLARLALEKKFREDLRYALSIFPIKVPSLKERGLEDLRLLAEHFMHGFAINENKKIKSISPQALELLSKQEWKDNVRQLRGCIFRAVVLCDDETLQPQHFPQLLNNKFENSDIANSDKKANYAQSLEIIELFDANRKCKTLSEIEEEIARKLIEKFNGNVSEVAKQLNIARSTLYRKLHIEEGSPIGSDTDE